MALCDNCEAGVPISITQVGLIGDETEEQKSLARQMHEVLTQMANDGYIRIELCGHLLCADNLKGFTLDKTKYRMRFEDETDESVRVIIERKDNDT